MLDEIFEEVVKNIKEEKVSVEKEQKRYKHALSFSMLGQKNMSQFARVFALIPDAEWEVVDNMKFDVELTSFIKTDEPLDNFHSQYIIFTFHHETYMTWYYFLDALLSFKVANTDINRLVLDCQYNIRERDMILDMIFKDADVKLRQHVQRYVDAREYEDKMWKKISKSIIKEKRIKNYKGFLENFKVNARSYSTKVHDMDTETMELHCYQNVPYCWQYDGKTDEVKDARVLRSEMFESENHIYLIAQVEDPRVWFRKWVTVDVKKRGAYVHEFMKELKSMLSREDVTITRNKLRDYGFGI